MSQGLTHATAIITGASTGIGRALALLMSEKGYDIGLLARRGDLLNQLRQDILRHFPDRKVFTASCDVTDAESCRRTIAGLADQLGHLDVFVANAGIGFRTPAANTDWKGVLQILQTNLIGAITSLEMAKEIMLNQREGHLVGISSVAATRGLPDSSAYCASKAGLSTYLESLRIDLKPYGILVTSVHPGYIATPMTEKNQNMPFLLSVEEGANQVFSAIVKKKKRYIFPWQLRPLVGFLHCMPVSLYDSMMVLYRRGIWQGKGGH